MPLYELSEQDVFWLEHGARNYAKLSEQRGDYWTTDNVRRAATRLENPVPRAASAPETTESTP